MPALLDGSALLTGWLLALSLPPWAPWWIGVVGGLFATVIAKQVFGGLGQNLFNPAMVARVALLISFPVPMTAWVGAAAAGLGDWRPASSTACWSRSRACRRSSTPSPAPRCSASPRPNCRAASICCNRCRQRAGADLVRQPRRQPRRNGGLADRRRRRWP